MEYVSREKKLQTTSSKANRWGNINPMFPPIDNPWVFNDIDDMSLAVDKPRELYPVTDFDENITKQIENTSFVSESVNPVEAKEYGQELTKKSDPQTEIDKKVKSLKTKYEKMILDAKSVGANVAAGNLRHFLDGTGTTRIISASWLRNYSVIEKGEDRIKGYFTDINIPEWSKRIQVGQTIQKNDYWIADMKSYNPFNELSYASGASKIRANGTFDLTGTDENNISVSGTVTMNWKDAYDWHEGLGFYIPGSGYINDEDAQFLEEHGGAKSFNMLSAWEYSFFGTYNIKTEKWSNVKWKYIGEVMSPSSTTTSGSTNTNGETTRRENRREYRNDRDQRREREGSRRDNR